MKKLDIRIAIILFMFTASCALGIDLSKWKYCAEVTSEGGGEEYCRLEVTPEIYNCARQYLADIRLIGEDKQQIPYIIVRPADVSKSYKYTPAVINRSTDGNTAMVTLDFGEQAVKNFIEVESEGDNFRRAVKVEGSNDNVSFFVLVKQAFVFSIGDRINSRFSGVDLPSNDYRYLRISVFPMAGEEKSPEIRDVRAFKCEQKKAERKNISMTLTKHTEEEKTNSSVYEYDMGFHNLPISEMQLNIADESFYRYVTIEGRDTTAYKVKIDSEDNRERFREVEAAWESVTSDTIYRYTSVDGKRCEKTVLAVPLGHVYRYLRVTIKNYDDRPVKLEGSTGNMTPHQLIFGLKGNAKATLYAGSESATMPMYDLRYKLNKPLEVKTNQAELKGIAENPIFGKTEPKAVPWTEKHKVLLLITMGIIVIVLAGIILKSFKSIPK